MLKGGMIRINFKISKKINRKKIKNNNEAQSK